MWTGQVKIMCLQKYYYSLFLFFSTGMALSCYECDDCTESQSFLNDHVKECPESYVSCLKTESKFAHHKTISRSCSQAPSVDRDCSTHLVNIMRVHVCLCSTSLCNDLDAFNDVDVRMVNGNPGTNGIVTGDNRDTSNFKNMPLHDFTEEQQQRIAAILGSTNSANGIHSYSNNPQRFFLRYKLPSLVQNPHKFAVDLQRLLLILWCLLAAAAI